MNNFTFSRTDCEKSRDWPKYCGSRGNTEFKCLEAPGGSCECVALGCKAGDKDCYPCGYDGCVSCTDNCKDGCHGGKKYVDPALSAYCVCKKNQAINAHRLMANGGVCTVDSDCDYGQTCFQGKCSSGKPCASGCMLGETCIDGKCISAPFECCVAATKTKDMPYGDPTSCALYALRNAQDPDLCNVSTSRTILDNISDNSSTYLMYVGIVGSVMFLGLAYYIYQVKRKNI